MAVEKYYNADNTMIGVLLGDGASIRCEDKLIHCDKRIIEFFLKNKPEKIDVKELKLFESKFNDFLKTLEYDAECYVNVYDMDLNNLDIFQLEWVRIGERFKIIIDSEDQDSCGCYYHLYEYIYDFNEEDWLVA